jgi:tetratricopeptide (TPR) repeat protein
MQLITAILNKYNRAEIMKFTKLATWMFLGLISAASDAYAQEVAQKARQRDEPAAQKSAGIEAYEKLLVEADGMVKNGKSADAYFMLEPIEFEHSGEERFDYLIGIAALDSGKPDKATLALERVLMVNPDSAAARLDIARAYYQLGDLPRAKTEFETSLQQNPSGTARANIEKYLEEIAEREAGKQTHFTGYVEGAVGHDSNVNNSTSQSQIFAGSTNYTLDPTNVKSSDHYYGVAAGGEVTHSLNANLSLYAGADLRQRGYHTQKSFDSFGLDARAGVMFGAKANNLSFGVLGGQYFLGDLRNSDTAGIKAEWRHVFSSSNQLNVFGQYARYRFIDQLMKPNDFDQHVIGGGWTHVLADGKSTLFGSLYHGTEKDVSPIITVTDPSGITVLNPSGGRNDGANRFTGLRIGSHAAISEKTTLFANAGGQVGDYSKVNYLFQQQRKDRLYDLTVGANWHWSKYWTLRPQLNYSKNDSNIVIYGFDRMDVSLNVRRDFR